jgi:hypothetical protein
MRDFSDVVDSFASLPGVEIVDAEPSGMGTEISIKRGNITAKFFVPNEGSEADIVRILADGGKGSGGGEGRRLIDDSTELLDSMGINGLRVVDGSDFWNRQPDFIPREGGVKVTHIKKW